MLYYQLGVTILYDEFKEAITAYVLERNILTFFLFILMSHNFNGVLKVNYLNLHKENLQVCIYVSLLALFNFFFNYV